MHIVHANIDKTEISCHARTVIISCIKFNLHFHCLVNAKKLKAKSFLGATRAHWAALISVSIALSQTPAEAASPRLVCRVECLFSSQLAPVPIYTA